jgi:hypothetical protein
MQTLQHGYKSVSLLLNLNADRILYLSTIAFALLAGAYLGSVSLN